MRAEAVQGLGGVALVAAGALLFADYLAGRIGGER